MSRPVSMRITDTLRNRASDAAQGRQRAVDAVARLRATSGERHACAGWSEPRWTSPNGSWPKRRFERARPCCEASHREIHDLAGRLIASQEVERARIARDLHDDSQPADCRPGDRAQRHQAAGCRACPTPADLASNVSSVAAARGRARPEHARPLARPASECARARGPGRRADRALRRHRAPPAARSDLQVGRATSNPLRPTPRYACIESRRRGCAMS